MNDLTPLQAIAHQEQMEAHRHDFQTHWREVLSPRLEMSGHKPNRLAHMQHYHWIRFLASRLLLPETENF